MLTAITKSLRLLDVHRKGRWLLLIALALLAGLFEAGGAILIFGLLQTVASPGSAPSIPLLGETHHFTTSSGLRLAVILIAAFFIVRGGLYLLQSYARNRVAHSAGVTLSRRLLVAYLRMPFSFHLGRNTSELIRNVHYSVLDIVVHGFIPMVAIASESLLVAGIVIALLISAPVMTLVMLGVLGPVILVMLRIVQPRLQALGSINQDMVAKNIKTLQQSFGGIREINLSGRRDYFESEYSLARAALSRSIYSKDVIQDTLRIVVETIIVLFILGFLGLSTATADGMTDAVAVLGLFAYAVFRVLPSFNRIMAGMNLLRYGFAAIEHVYDDVMKMELAAPAESRQRIPLRRSLVVDGVSFRYGPDERDVLLDIQLEISRGESIGFVGATGSGKTTLIDIIVGLLSPSQGRILVDGSDITSNLRGWQDQIGMVPQVVFLLDDSLRRNIAFGYGDDEIDDASVERAVDLAQLRSVVTELPDGLDSIVGERGVRLSGGQRQRVAIARALYADPSVLVLDEGTSALDTSTEARFVSAIEHLREEKTLLIVAHRLTTVKGCDRIVVMKEGRVIDIGTYMELESRNDEFRDLAHR